MLGLKYVRNQNTAIINHELNLRDISYIVNELQRWDRYNTEKQRNLTMGENNGNIHSSDVIMTAMAPQINSHTIVYSTVIQRQIKENIKAPHHRSMCGELAGDRWIPRTNGQ